MKTIEVEVLPAPSVRKSLTTPGDIRSDISFQNDINALLARIEEAKQPWTAAFRLTSFGVAVGPVAQRRRNSATPPLRIFDGGAANRQPAAAPRSPGPTVVPQRKRRRA